MHNFSSGISVSENDLFQHLCLRIVPCLLLNQTPKIHHFPPLLSTMPLPQILMHHLSLMTLTLNLFESFPFFFSVFFFTIQLLLLWHIHTITNTCLRSCSSFFIALNVLSIPFRSTLNPAVSIPFSKHKDDVCTKKKSLL